MLKFPRTCKKIIATDKGKDLLSVAFICIVAFILLGRVVFQGKVLLPLDMLYTAEPWKSESTLYPNGPLWNYEITDAIWQFLPMGSYAQKNRHEGRTPYWDASVLAGMPAFARGEMFSNPVFSLTSTFLTVERAISWTAVLHVLIAGISMFLFLRELGARQPGALVGGLTFMLNSYLIGWLSLPAISGSMVWLPLIFWSYERSYRRSDWRWALPGALAFAAQIQSGSILWPFYGAITFGLYLAYRSVVDWWSIRQAKPALMHVLYGGLILVVGAGLAVTQLTLTVQLYLHSLRNEALGLNSFLNIFTHLPRLLVPGILGTPLMGDHYIGIFNFVETNLYIGILPLFFCLAGLVSKHRKLILGFGILGTSCLLAVYQIAPFPQIISFVYPVFYNTFPGRIFYVVTFALAIMAGLGADGLFELRPKLFLIRLGLASAIIASILLASWIFLSFILPLEGFRAVFDPKMLIKWGKIEPGSLLFGFGWLAGTSILLWLWQYQKIHRWKLISATLLIICFDLGIANFNLNPVFDPEISFPLTPSLKYLQDIQTEQDQPNRILNVNSGEILPGMTPQFYGLSTASGYSSWLLAEYSLYADLTGSRALGSINQIYYADCCTSLQNALNVKYVYTSPEVILTSYDGLDLRREYTNAELSTNSPDIIHYDIWEYEGENKLVLFEHSPASIKFKLHSNHLTMFVSEIALNPESWPYTDGVEFVVSALIEGEREDVLFSRYVNPKDRPDDRKLIPVEIDLSRYRGREFTLTLSTNAGPRGDASFDWAGWVAPIILDYQPRTLQLIYDGPNKVYENNVALPRAWIVHRITRVPKGDKNALARLLGAKDFDPAAEGIVESAVTADFEEELGEPHPDDQVKILSYMDDQVKIEANTATPGLLVLADNMYPGWQVYVDGIQQPVVTTNLIMRGVFLQPGTHQIDFVFRPSGYKVTTTIARVIVALIIIGFVLGGFRKSPIRKGSGPELELLD